MAKVTSLKRLQINKANTIMVAAVATAAFVSVFSLVAARALWSTRGYQQRVINEKEATVAQLEANIAAVDDLVVAYKTFVDAPKNMMGGSSTGNGPRDGDNAKITLDSLPSKYDFPALATSLEKIMQDRKYTISAISGVDDEIAQSTVVATSAQPVEMLFDMSGTNDFSAATSLLATLERSIRPITVTKVGLSGSDGKLGVTVSAKSYYQPEKPLNVNKKVVK